MKTVCRIVLLCCISLALPFTGRANDIVFRHIDNQDGLSDNQVRGILSLPDGRIIFRTVSVVNVYDATSFRQSRYHIDQTYSWNYQGFEQQYLDADNRLWLKSNGLLLLLDLKKNHFIYSIDDILREMGIEEPIRDLFMDENHGFWFLTQRDRLYYRPSTEQKARLLPSPSGALRSMGTILTLTQKDTLMYVLYDSGWLRTFNARTGHFEQDDAYLVGKLAPDMNRYQLKTDQSGNLLIMLNGKTGGLFQRNLHTGKWGQRLPSGHFYTAFDIDQAGTLWVGSRAGLFMLTPEGTSRFISPFTLTNGSTLSNDINAVHCDPKGGIWIGLFNRGVLYYHPNIRKITVLNRTTTAGGPWVENDVRCLLEISDGKLLVGTVNGLMVFDPDNNHIKPFQSGLNKAFCLDFFRDSKGDIWLSTLNEGLYRIHGQSVRRYVLKSPMGDRAEYNVRSFYEDSDGQCYACSERYGFGLFNPENGAFQPLRETHPELVRFRLTTHMVPFDKKQLLVATQNGLFIYHTDSHDISIPPTGDKALDNRFRHSNNKYNCLYVDSRHNIWFGTQDGLNVWCPAVGKSYAFYMEDGLTSNTIQAIVEDSSHHIWATTTNGLTRISLSEHAGEPVFSLVSFNRFDGLSDGELYERSAIVTKAGWLYAGGINGLNQMNISQLPFEKGTLKPLFVKLRLFNTDVSEEGLFRSHRVLDKPITETAQLDLAYNENYISLDFSALNYINPTQTYYRYKLEGVDEDWIILHAKDGTGRATYTGLKPGRYRFLVYAANNSKDWGNQCTELSLRIRKPFWSTTVAWLLYVLLFLGLSYEVLRWQIRKNQREMKRKQEEKVNQERAKLDQLKMQFFTNISHEFRTPLTLILTPLESILRKTTDETLRKQLQLIHKSATDLNKLVNQLLDFRRIERQGEKLTLSCNDIVTFMDTIHEAFREAAKEKRIAFSIEHHKSSHYLYFDREKMLRVMNNLLSNAFKFTPEEGKITIRLREKQSSHPTIEGTTRPLLRIDIEDNGSGIPKDDLAHLFERFYQASNHTETGSGIGLHIVREYVRMHQGDVTVVSNGHEGTVFSVFIPMDLQPEANESADAGLESPATPPDSKTNEQRPTLLVVEDNRDFRFFLAEQLREMYQVIEAADGMEALNILSKHMPDIIISDVMMPKMDGIELCTKVKTDIKTSHIPFILLTAKVSEEAQIQGYEAGADAYLAKPFNMEMLVLRIRKLLEQQKMRHQLFKKTITVNPSTITITSLDEKLVQRVLNCVEKNMDNPAFSVEELSVEVGMNRAHLYRKLQSITGMSPSEFIRSIRLKRAAQLLDKGQLSVNEVVDLVGFNTTKYFSRHFRDMFGVYPSNYKKRGSDPTTEEETEAVDTE